jgi:hypothetical protein
MNECPNKRTFDGAQVELSRLPEVGRCVAHDPPNRAGSNQFCGSGRFRVRRSSILLVVGKRLPIDWAFLVFIPILFPAPGELLHAAKNFLPTHRTIGQAANQHSSQQGGLLGPRRSRRFPARLSLSEAKRRKRRGPIATAAIHGGAIKMCRIPTRYCLFLDF